GRTARRITLDDVNLRKRGIAFLAVSEFAWQHGRSQCPFANDFPGLTRGFATIFLATGGFCSKNSVSRSFRNDSTAPFTSEFSFPFVWPSNCGCGNFTEITATRPSRTSSPVSELLKFFARPDDCA